MTELEIKQGIELLCSTSTEVKSYYEDDNNIVNALNAAKKEDLEKALKYYASRSGVVIDVRKELIQRLFQGEQFTVESLKELISRYREGKERQFKSYKETFSIVFPAITFYGHNPQREFVEAFTKRLISDLDIEESTKKVWFDFQGARQQGSDRYWVALYNKNQESHSTGIQFFIEFYNGEIGYGVYKHENQEYLKPRVTKTPKEFNYAEMLNYFGESKGLLLDDGINFKKEEKNIEATTVNLPKNLILYGPPGTGKTFLLSNKYFKLFTENKKVVTKEDKQKELAEKRSWWEIITLCMLDLKEGKVNDVLNHSLLSAKSAISETKNVRATIWSLLQTFTKKDCPNVNLTKRRDPEIFWKSDNSIWSIDVDVVKEQLPEIYEEFEWMNQTEKVENSKQRFKTVTFHQSYSYEDFIEGIKPVLETEGAESSEIGYQIEAGIFKRICLEAKNDTNNPYAIFIDEINRGNVASIFGELITLIESDKRSGEKNELSLELPYSKKSFSVPSNLHIIGTMNTADRSVEALDTALRRRFSFIEMTPDPKRIEIDGASNGIIDDIDLVELLNTLNERIEILVDRDHTIGHAFFMDAVTLSDLKAVISDKIIPLLQEYFYGDYHKMELVIGKGFFEKSKVEKIKFAVPTDLQFEGELFSILDAKEMTDSTFKLAIDAIGVNAE